MTSQSRATNAIGSMKPLAAEVRKEDGYWSVFVNGQRMIDRESFAVADRIRECLEYPGVNWYSEAEDVADSIRRYFAKAGAQ